jgi:DNA invertase Pin-like site-specific DNA recombinase
MPKVGKKHFPYTPQGQAQAALERQKREAMNSKAQQGIAAAMREGGQGGYSPPPGRKPRKGYRPPEIGKKKTPNYGGSDR